MSNLIPSRAASIIYGLTMGTFGVLHFNNAEIMAARIPDYLPGDPKLWVYIVAVAFILSALAIIINKLTRPACYLLALMLLVFVFTVHLPKAIDGDMSELLKDTALAMAAIIIGNTYKVGGINNT